MKEIKTQKRYKCDFCKKRSIAWIIERHEKQCYRNPNRICQNCKNGESSGNYTNDDGECLFCANFDKQKLAEIEAREKGESLLY